MIHSAQAPPQGAYLEVRRGRHAIIARVVWTKDQRFGVSTQDPLSVEAIVRELDLSAPEARHSQEDAQPLERRAMEARARAAGERHERSRTFSRAFEFACIAIAGGSAGLALYGMVVDGLARPLTKVTAALTRE